MKSLGRSIAIAALTASAVTVGAATASAAPAPQNVQTQQVSATVDSAAHSVTATLASGMFVNNLASHSIDVLDAAGLLPVAEDADDAVLIDAVAADARKALPA